MIELRWYVYPSLPVEGGGFTTGRTVLQHRTGSYGTESVGVPLSEAKWEWFGTDWQDVPVVQG